MLFAHEVDNSNRCNNWANEKRSVFDKYNYCFKNCGKKPENLNHYIVNTSLTPEKTEIKNMSLKKLSSITIFKQRKNLNQTSAKFRKKISIRRMSLEKALFYCL